MKTKYLVFGIFIILFSATLNLVSCNKNENEEVSAYTVKKEVLADKTLLGEDIYLPKGTIWYYTNAKKNEVAFELPKDYTFLIKDGSSERYLLSDEGAGYSCTCSGGGSCTTFYNKDLGYGCLQSTCGGSCTGKASKSLSDSTIEGVLYKNNNTVDSDINLEKASLSHEGKKGFFKVKEVREEIKRTYDLIYKNSAKPNFDSKTFEKDIDSKSYLYAKTILYGFELGLIIPKDDNLKKLMPQLRTLSLEDDSAPKSCKCSGTTGGDSCKLEKEGLFGYVAYYCTGCSTCTMN